MSKTYELLREAEASFQDNNQDQNEFEDIEKCLYELQLSYNQVLTQDFDALRNSYIQINTVIADPYKYFSLQKDNLEPSDVGLLEFLAKRRLQIFERIDKILKNHVFNKIYEMISKIEDANIRVKINQRVKQLEFLEYKKRTNSTDCSIYEQIIGELGQGQNTNEHPQSNSDKSNSSHTKNNPVRFIISQILQRLKKD